MAKAILQLFMATPSEAWYQMSKKEQDRLMAKQAKSVSSQKVVAEQKINTRYRKCYRSSNKGILT